MTRHYKLTFKKLGGGKSYWIIGGWSGNTVKKFYRNQKPSTSKQLDTAFFFRNTNSEREKQEPRVSNRTKSGRKISYKGKGKQSQEQSSSSFKNKRRECLADI